MEVVVVVAVVAFFADDVAAAMGMANGEVWSAVLSLSSQAEAGDDGDKQSPSLLSFRIDLAADCNNNAVSMDGGGGAATDDLALLVVESSLRCEGCGCCCCCWLWSEPFGRMVAGASPFFPAAAAAGFILGRILLTARTNEQF